MNPNQKIAIDWSVSMLKGDTARKLISPGLFQPFNRTQAKAVIQALRAKGLVVLNPTPNHVSGVVVRAGVHPVCDGGLVVDGVPMKFHQWA